MKAAGVFHQSADANPPGILWNLKCPIPKSVSLCFFSESIGLEDIVVPVVVKDAW